MLRRKRGLLIFGVIIFLAAWLAWKVLHTASTIAPPVPVTRGSGR
jgi:hypothetical protein